MQIERPVADPEVFPLGAPRLERLVARGGFSVAHQGRQRRRIGDK